MIELILSLFLLFVGVVFKEDIKALLPILTRSIIRSAARKLPQNLQGRYYEEWLAHSDELPTWVQRLTHAASLYCIGATAICHSKNDKFARTRRILDISVAILTLPVIAPVFFIIFFANKTDGGPACWTRRIHRCDGSSIQLLKFRTIGVCHDGTVKNYKLGTFLRKSALDEIPLLLNVLRGDISFFGQSIYQDDTETVTAKPLGLVDMPCAAITTHRQFIKWYFLNFARVTWSVFTYRSRA